MTELSIMIVEGANKEHRKLGPGERLLINRSTSSTDTPCPEPAPLPPSSVSTKEWRFCASSPRVSQNHAEIKMHANGRAFLKDMGSTNGTFLRVSPFQEYELQDDFEVWFGTDVQLYRQSPLWDEESSVGVFASLEDLVGHLRTVLRKFIRDISIVPANRVEGPPPGMCTCLPLSEKDALLVVQWQHTTFNLAIERWLQRRVVLFNSGALGQPPPNDSRPWEFTAASAERRQVLQLARRVAPTMGTVLLLGESGVGKEVLAHDLHRHSNRRKRALVAINCGAMPKDLLAGLLFGTKKGAYTGAEEKPGLFEEASGGTLFLDEIGELPLDVQATLLRALDERKIRRIGNPPIEIPVDVRIIAATNRNLEKMVAEKTFRADLYWRLSAVPLIIPCLRPTDVMAMVPLLCQQLVQDGYSELSDEEVLRVSRCATTVQWTGNARDLKNALVRYLTYREPSATAEQNWQQAMRMRSHQPAVESSHPLPPPSVPPTSEPEETPDGLMKKLTGHIDALMFLDFARRILFPWHRGKLTKLGVKLGMTGAGAASRLKDYGITGIADGNMIDPAVIDSQIASERAKLQPHAEYLRTLLGL